MISKPKLKNYTVRVVMIMELDADYKVEAYTEEAAKGIAEDVFTSGFVFKVEGTKDYSRSIDITSYIVEDIKDE